MKAIAHLVTGIIMLLVLLFTFAILLLILLLILLALPTGSAPSPAELVWSGEAVGALDMALPALMPGACIDATRPQ